MILPTQADVGRIIKIVGGTQAHLLRGSERTVLEVDKILDEGDEIVTEDAHVVVQIYPATQLGLSKGGRLKLSRAFIESTGTTTRSQTVIGLLKGLLRVEVNKESGEDVEQKIEADEGNVAFSVRGTDFEVSVDDDVADLDVYEGEVEVSSPHVNTFVPYIVKKQEGFRYPRRKRVFEKRAFSPRMKEAHFVPRERLRERWKLRRELKQERREKRESRRDVRENRRGERRKRPRN